MTRIFRRAVPRSAGVSTLSGTRVHARHRNAHIRFQGAQLLQLLAPFERRGRQGDKARQGVAAIGIDADMMKQGAFAGGRGGAGEIKRAAKPAVLVPGDHGLHHAGIVALGGIQ